MALLLVPITAPTAEQAGAEMRLAFERGADGVELRLDYQQGLTPEQIADLAAAVPAGKLLVATQRSRDEGGRAEGSKQERLDRLLQAAESVGAIDVEYALWQRLGEGPQERLHGPRILILSRHDLTGRPPRLATDLLDMVQTRDADIIKLAWIARTVRENFEAFELMRECPKPIIAICMGEAGVLSRILCGKFGGYATFAALGDPDGTHLGSGGPRSGERRRPAGAEPSDHSVAEGSLSVPSALRGFLASWLHPTGQLSIEQMKRLYRWDAIRGDTDVYGVIGHPVSHSLGPAVHNAAFEAERINAVYCPLLVKPGYESFKAFMVEALARPWFGLRGVSITAPHKENALRFAREIGGRIDDAAVRIGAVNTFLLDPAGGLRAANTDAAAARDALLQGVGLKLDDLRGLSVAILGAGGAARACLAGLTAAGASVTIYNRGDARAAALAGEFGCAYRPWAHRPGRDNHIVINCTTLGQPPHAAESPLDAGALRPSMIVFDTAYRPRPTRLLADAHARGCRTIDGLEMFLLQAAGQWQEWLACPAPHDVMRIAALSQLAGDSVVPGP